MTRRSFVIPAVSLPLCAQALPALMPVSTDYWFDVDPLVPAEYRDLFSIHAISALGSEISFLLSPNSRQSPGFAILKTQTDGRFVSFVQLSEQLQSNYLETLDTGELVGLKRRRAKQDPCTLLFFNGSGKVSKSQTIERVAFPIFGQRDLWVIGADGNTIVNSRTRQTISVKLGPFFPTLKRVSGSSYVGINLNSAILIYVDLAKGTVQSHPLASPEIDAARRAYGSTPETGALVSDFSTTPNGDVFLCAMGARPGDGAMIMHTDQFGALRRRMRVHLPATKRIETSKIRDMFPSYLCAFSSSLAIIDSRGLIAVARA